MAVYKIKLILKNYSETLILTTNFLFGRIINSVGILNFKLNIFFIFDNLSNDPCWFFLIEIVRS